MADKSWYAMKGKAGPEAVVHIYDEIGFGGMSAQAFVEELRAIKARVINLHVNSPGGAVFEGITIYNSLRQHPARVNVFVDGMAASIASVVAQAGDRIVMAEGSMMMIHEPYGAAKGNSETMEKMAEWLGKGAETVAGIYASRAGGDPARWRQLMRAETWYRAGEAVQAGLAHEVYSSASNPAAQNYRVFNLAEFKHVPDWAQIRAAMWDTAFINNLPDSAFAYIAPGGTKDADGRTKPRSLRYLPHHMMDGAVDMPHLRNALSRAPQTNLPADAKAQALRHLQSHARREGVGEN